MDKKKQIEEMYIDALNNDEAPNVFANRILILFGVTRQSEQLFCTCERPDPYKMMPETCFRCRGKIVKSK